MVDEEDSTAVAWDTTFVADVHPQDSPEDRGFLIITGDRKATLRIRGSIRLNGIYDFDGLQSRSTFSTYDIPVGEDLATEPRFYMGANQTRLGIEANRETSLGEAFLKIEGDFRGPGNSFRLRHAYGRLRKIIGGQTWSTFSDVSTLPTTVDLDGPNSAVAERTVQIRYTDEISDDWSWSLAIESPKPEIERPDTLILEPTFQSFPDVAGRLRTQGKWGHLQLAAIVVSITVKDEEGKLNYLAGGGGLLSGRLSISENNELLFQAVGGSAISRFITALAGKGLDVVYNPETQQFETVLSGGGFVSLGHRWKANAVSYLTAGVIGVENMDFQPDNAFRSSGYISGNLFWETTPGTRLGLEYSYGERVNKNGASGTAQRFSFCFYYDF
jgi:hypothetical protein